MLSRTKCFKIEGIHSNVPFSLENQDLDVCLNWAKRIGFPVVSVSNQEAYETAFSRNVAQDERFQRSGKYEKAKALQEDSLRVYAALEGEF